ncbi:MAG: scpB [Micavibrio sp.]|nr:scpB [Micavibrio sp.]
MNNTAEDLEVMDEAPVVMHDEAPVARDPNTIRALEAMLFASAQPLTLAAMRERLPEGADVGGMLLELQKLYEPRGIAISNLEGQWAIRTAPDLGDVLAIKKEVRRPLSRAAMETLAIVAYHQPITRAEIENIRGVVTSGGTLDILMEEGWVKPGRRRETPGRPLTWVTTTDFLDHFGLQSLTELPGLDELKASGLLDRRPSIEITTGDMFEEMVAEDEARDAVEEDAMATEEELASLKADRAVEEDEDELEENAGVAEASASGDEDSDNEDSDGKNSDEEVTEDDDSEDEDSEGEDEDADDDEDDSEDDDEEEDDK